MVFGEGFQNFNPLAHSVVLFFKVLHCFRCVVTGMAETACNEDFWNIVFVPPKESESKRKECIKKSVYDPPFGVGKRIIVLL